MSTFTNKSGNSFLDEDHDNLLKQLDYITNLVRFDFEPTIFKNKLSHFILSIENHIRHEEVILKGACFIDFDRHSIEHRRFLMKLRMDNIELLTLEEATDLIIRLRTNIFNHEIYFDQQYWPLLQDSKEDEILVRWNLKYDTEHKIMNRNRKALVNYVNSLYQRIQENPDKTFAAKELNNLYEYSKSHFSEVNLLPDSSLLPGHKANHENLLIDLKTLILEIKQDKCKIASLGDYLKYWLLSHIQTFDIPAFKSEM